MNYKHRNNEIEVQFQYVWRFVPYEANSPKFRIALHITTVDTDYVMKSYKDFPDLVKVMNSILKVGYCVSSRLVPAIVIFEFDKEHNNIIDCINKVKLILKVAGIRSGKYVDLYSGFPNIFYGEEYLGYTVGTCNGSLTDIIAAMTGKCDIREQFGRMPVVGDQKFCEMEDTNMDYLSDLLSNELNRLNVRVMNLKCVVKDAVQERRVKTSLDNMYSTDKDDSWSKFQGMW